MIMSRSRLALLCSHLLPDDWWPRAEIFFLAPENSLTPYASGTIVIAQYLPAGATARQSLHSSAAHIPAASEFHAHRPPAFPMPAAPIAPLLLGCLLRTHAPAPVAAHFQKVFVVQPPAA